MHDQEEKRGKSPFTIDNYPKSYASTRPGDYRMKDFLILGDAKLEKLTNELFKFCTDYADQATPIREYKGFPYLDSGWEWSVFKKDDKTVIKIPANIFPEVNDVQYLDNSKDSYDKFIRAYPTGFIAKTEFRREDGINIMEQEFIRGKSDFTLDKKTNDQTLLTNFRIFLISTLKLVRNERWLPDYWFDENEKGILVRNVVVEDETRFFKIIDFTQYTDPSRMYPAKTERVIAGQIKRLGELLSWVDKHLKESF